MLCGNNCVVNGSFSLDDCVGYKKLRDALQMYFKYDEFRPGQLEAVLPVVHGKDVFVCLPVEGSRGCVFFSTIGNKQSCYYYCREPVNKSKGSTGECKVAFIRYTVFP